MAEKKLIKMILLAFEQSSTNIKYDQVYRYEDGPNNKRQLTVSFGVTEYGNLKKLIESYCQKKGRYTEDFKKYLPKIGKEPLVNDTVFGRLLTESGSDPVMQMCQEEAYENIYINPAYKWCETNKLVLPLSKAVICDSFLQSGSILSSIRNMFPETIDNEKKWVTAYCRARKSWLANHSRTILHNTTYRMDFMLDRINDDDWDLDQSCYRANGVLIRNV